MYKRYFAVTFVTCLLLPFQNCSLEPTHSGSTTLESFSGCEAPLKRVFRDTYWPMAKSACTSCHSDGGESGRFFGSKDFNIAYGYFKSIGRQTVETKALDVNHKPPNTGPQHSALIQSVRGRWLAAETEYNDCSGGAEVKTTPKSNAAIYTNPANPNAQLNWTRVNWLIATEVSRASLQNRFSAEISIEIRRHRTAGSTTDIGYQFRNPRIRIIDDGNANTPLPIYRLRGLRVFLNGELQTNFTFFSSVDYTNAQNTQDQLVAGGLGYSFILSAVNNTDQFAIQYDSIINADGAPVGPGPGPGPGPVLPTRVSYADLTSANQQLGVFTQSCRSCHNAGNSAGGLNLDDYTQARNAAGNIVARMNNATRPMPTSGLLSQEKREIVNIWLSSGTPQN